VVAHVEAARLVVGWQYLLFSDGLTDMFDVNGIERILQANPPGAAASARSSWANRGWYNASVMEQATLKISGSFSFR
jgi:hypothetical protein